jgi:23S rRNA (uridine2552-2'-O)-methyltransferase
MAKKNNAWLKEHFNDEYVKRSQNDGFRSRAVYKLQELDQKNRLFQKNMRIVELGAAPGGWSEYIARKLGDTGIIIANDLLPMEYLEYVTFIQGDFRSDSVLEQIMKKVENKKVDLVLSDMSPNISGVVSVDQTASIYLVELALELAKDILKPNGQLLMKVFQGSGFEPLLKHIKIHFNTVKIRKPKASRSRSKEVYLYASGFMR